MEMGPSPPMAPKKALGMAVRATNIGAHPRVVDSAMTSCAMRARIADRQAGNAFECTAVLRLSVTPPQEVHTGGFKRSRGVASSQRAQALGTGRRLRNIGDAQ